MPFHRFLERSRLYVLSGSANNILILLSDFFFRFDLKHILKAFTVLLFKQTKCQETRYYSFHRGYAEAMTRKYTVFALLFRILGRQCGWGKNWWWLNTRRICSASHVPLSTFPILGFCLPLLLSHLWRAWLVSLSFPERNGGAQSVGCQFRNSKWLQLLLNETWTVF